MERLEHMRRKDRETSREAAWEIFDQSAYSVLSMIYEGKPYATALSVARIGETLYFHCAREGEKLQALRHNPQVCLHAVSHMRNCAEKFTVYYASCTIKGCAKEVQTEEERHQALLAICAAFTPGNMEKAQKEIQSAGSSTSVWKIQVDEISGKCHPEK